MIDLDKLILMWKERKDTLSEKTLSDAEWLNEIFRFLYYAQLAIEELNERTKENK